MEEHMFLSEMHCGCESQSQVLVQSQLTQYAHAESRVVVVNVGIPLFSCFGVYETVVLQLHILYVRAYEEAIVQFPLIQIGAVHHLALLCICPYGAT